MKSFNALILAMVLLMGAVSAEAKVLEDTVATVNGTPILLSEYEKRLENIVTFYKRTAPALLRSTAAVAELRTKVLDQIVDDAVLSQEAKRKRIKVRERELEAGVMEVKSKFTRDPSGRPIPEDKSDRLFQKELDREGLTFNQFKKRIRKQIMIRKLIDREIKPLVKIPSDKEVRKYYDKIELVVEQDTDTFKNVSKREMQEMNVIAQQLREATSERIRARHILVEVPQDGSIVERSAALKKIKLLQKKLDDDEDFADVARKHSEDPGSARRGGDLGPIVRGMMVEAFEKAAFKLPVGEVSGIVKTEFGYHLIRVEEKRAEQKLNFEDVKEELRKFLYNSKLQKRLEDLVKDLKKSANIKLFPPKDD